MSETFVVFALIGVVIGIAWVLVDKHRSQKIVSSLHTAAAKLREVFKSDKK
jgi:hypothetical protein